jgi:general stress protein YciG
MPNNNPHGHNQYTRAEDRNSKAQTPAPPADTMTDAAAAAAPSGTSRRGFASMDEQTQREIASKGGHSQGRDNNPGNFANDRDKAREAGRKGGEAHGSHR